MRLFSLALLTASALVLALAGGVAIAQTPPAPSAAVTAPSPAHTHTHLSLTERFTAANTTKDGHLTLDQARAGLPSVGRHFAEIDKDNKGYVTLDDIRAHYKELRAAHRQTQTKSSNG
jgi:hypothetical protein